MSRWLDIAALGVQINRTPIFPRIRPNMSHHVLNGLSPPFRHAETSKFGSIPLTTLIQFEGWRDISPVLANARSCAPKIDGWFFIYDK